jgi:GTP-binding protein
VGTGQLNRIVRTIVGERGPTNRYGSEARVYFASQVKTYPPTIVLVVNDPDRFTQNYERYLLNKFREILPYDEVPIRIILRSKSRVEKRAAGTTGSGKDILHIPDQMTGEFDSDLPVEMIDTEALLADLPDDARAYFDD